MPKKTSQLINDSGYTTQSSVNQMVSQIASSVNQTINQMADQIPTSTSQLENDSGFVNLNDRLIKGAGDSAIIECEINNNKAEGDFSHVEGSENCAVGSESHAEGYRVVAAGEASHAEGGGDSGTSLSLSGEAGTTIYETNKDNLYPIKQGFVMNQDMTVYITDIITVKENNIKKTQIQLNKTINPNEEIKNKSYLFRSAATGEFSHTEGHYTTTLGSYSHAEGDSSTAIGQASHAEGMSKACGSQSHSEGGGIAYGAWSHAEGHGRAYGYSTHAEGSGRAYGENAHAEGSGFAYGRYSHAEGSDRTFPINLTTVDQNLNKYKVDSGQKYVYIGAIVTILNSDEFVLITNIEKNNDDTFITTSKQLSPNSLTNKECSIIFGAIGEYSHTEGYATIAASDYQHVQGKCNIPDPNNTYACIVGGGTDYNKANIHTLDWDGNGWYAGKLAVGVGPTNDMEVATKQYVDNQTGNKISSTSVTAIWTGTQAEYDALTPDANTLYFIQEV